MHWYSLVAVALLVAACWPSASFAQTNEQRITADLTLQQFLLRVMERNESIQARILEWEANRRKFKGERGVFEPELVGSAEHQENRRENTAQERRSLLSPVFDEKNNIYNGGLESLVPTGARIRLGYTLRDLKNNLQTNVLFGTPVTNGEYQAFFGFSLTQPVLRNGGRAATMANIRLAALSSDIAFQDYRRQMMLIISTAEAAYWNLYMAQEQLLFFRDSVRVAETIRQDNEVKRQAGKGSELEVLEAEAGLALRLSKQAEARQKFFEAANRLMALYAETPVSTNRLVIAVDEPEVRDIPFSYFDAWQAAFDLNPDYLGQRKKVLAEGVRLGYARNQRLPELDLKGAYGLNGLGLTPHDSWRDLEHQEFPSWSIGAEMRIPIGGGIKSRNELEAARLRQKEALLLLKELETQIGTALDSSLHKMRSAFRNVDNYKKVVEFSQNLLDTQLARLAVGKVESRKVLEVEADLLEARNSLLDSKVQFQRALLELQLVEGSLLKRRNLDLTQFDLEQRTRNLARRGQVTDAELAQLMKELQWDYQNRGPGMDGPMELNARRVLQDRSALQSDPARPMSDQDLDKALRLLHDQMQQP